jgi:hypothetical protein
MGRNATADESGLIIVLPDLMVNARPSPDSTGQPYMLEFNSRTTTNG